MNLDRFKSQLEREKKKKQSQNNVANLLAGAFFIGIIVLIAVAVVNASSDSGSGKPKPAANTPEGIAENCLSSWDGNSDELEAVVRGVLNDPSSMETYETRYNGTKTFDMNDDGIKEIFIVMEYGANNAFGGKVRQTATAYIDQNCRVVEPQLL